MPRPSLAEERLWDEIQQIDRSILLLVSARCRPAGEIASLAQTPRTGTPDPGGARRAEASLLAWAEDTKTSPRLAVRVARWVARESARRPDPQSQVGDGAITCFVRPVAARPPRRTDDSLSLLLHTNGGR
jgi:hypothetical protein